MTYMPAQAVKDSGDHQVLATGLIFHGSLEELFRLQVAMEHNCQLRQQAAMNHTTAMDAKLCPVHGIAFDQRALDGLAWMHRFAGKLLSQEFCPDGEITRPAFPEDWSEAA